MQKISEHLIEDFVNVVLEETNIKRVESYGTLIERGDGKYVKLDGSNIETPLMEAIDAENGDRIKVQIENHNAVCTGNFTTPASGRYAVAFVKNTPEGILIGKLNPDHKPTGKSVLIKPDGMYIVDIDGAILGKFVRDDASHTTIVDLAKGATVIKGQDAGGGEILIGKSLGMIKIANAVAINDNGSNVDVDIGRGKSTLRLGQSKGYYLTEITANTANAQVKILMGNSKIEINPTNGGLYFCSEQGSIFYDISDGILQFGSATGKAMLNNDRMLTASMIKRASGKLIFSANKKNPRGLFYIGDARDDTNFESPVTNVKYILGVTALYYDGNNASPIEIIGGYKVHVSTNKATLQSICNEILDSNGYVPDSTMITRFLYVTLNYRLVAIDDYIWSTKTQEADFEFNYLEV